jgi:hypothetical protein
MNPKKPRIIKKAKPQPMKLIVKFPIMDTPREIKQAKLIRLINHVSTMSTEEFKFVFETPDFMGVV